MPSAPLALAVLAAAGLAACGDAAPPEVVVTVTATPTPAASTSATASSAPTESAKVADPTSDVRGRAFDFGVVTGTKRAGEVDVLVLDRWTDPKVPDERLAKRGVAVGPWTLGSDRYVNQNDQRTFDIPVRRGTTFLLHHCVATGEPLESRTVTATELADAPESDRLVLVTVDADGWATGGETLPGC